MPYRDKDKDRRWHKDKMRERRVIMSLTSRFVTPSTSIPVLIGTPWIEDIGEFVDSASEFDADEEG